jgi:hypothetical protein
MRAARCISVSIIHGPRKTRRLERTVTVVTSDAICGEVVGWNSKGELIRSTE